MKLLKTQDEYDRERRAYAVIFPNPMPDDQVRAFLRALHSTLPTAMFDMVAPRATVVFEAWAASTGISYRLLVPWNLEDQVTSELRHLVPGAIVVPDDKRPAPVWDDIVQVGLSDRTRTIDAHNPEDITTDLLSALGHALVAKETAVVQWVLSPASYTPPPSEDAVSTRYGVFSTLMGHTASKGELDDRRRKLTSSRYLVIGRIAAKAETKDRARFLVDALIKGLKTANGSSRFTFKEKTDIIAVNAALTPWRFPGVLNIDELIAASGFPLGSPNVPGLPRPSARHFYATEAVVQHGRLLGLSNHPSQKGRRIAQSYETEALSHTLIEGRTGYGKTAYSGNNAAQDMAKGYGVIVIDASNSNSPETMFNGVSDLIPPDRLDDVIMMDVAADVHQPVGLNLLDQSHPHMVRDILTGLLETIYADTKGVWTPQLIYNGMSALVDYGNATIMDLARLIRPRPEEQAWYRAVKKAIKNPNVRRYFEEWDALDEKERITRSQPLWNRLWQLNNRSEVHNILGQTHSSFQLRDVLQNNRILLVNLAGLPSDTASLFATLLTSALWTEAQGIETPAKPNFIYIDELQQATKADIGLKDMLARGRKHNFFLTMSTQYLKGQVIPEETRIAIANHAATKVMFANSLSEANFWQPEFGKTVAASDIAELKRYDALARIAGVNGISEPVSFTALEPFEPLHTADRARSLSRQKYGRTLEEIEADIEARFMVKADTPVPEGVMGESRLDDRS